MNIDKQRKEECLKTKCKYAQRCLAFHGYDCVRLGGHKIPIESLVKHKQPKFRIIDGWRIEA